MVRLEYTIPAQWDGKQISLILKNELNFSTLARKSLRESTGSLLLDGLSVPGHTSVQAGQCLTILLPDDPPCPIEAVEGPLEILFEDAHLLVLNKPAGVPVHPGPSHHWDTLGNFVTWHYQRQNENHLFRPVNRLDKGTSGLMCVAKHGYAADRLREQLHSPAFRRGYLALCQGVPEPPEGVIDAPIGRKAGSVIEREVRPDGKRAITKYKIIQDYVNYSLIEVSPQTGRTHQIRVHMAYVGHPLAGDFLYGTEDHSLIARPALHSAQLEFDHPITRQRMTFTAHLPEDMKHIIQ